MLSKASEAPVGSVEYETDVEILNPYIQGHKVCGVALCPASVFCELGVAAASHAFGAEPSAKRYTVEDVEFRKPLVTGNESDLVLITRVEPHPATQAYRFTVLSRRETSDVRTAHSSGLIKLVNKTVLADRTERLLAESAKVRARVDNSAAQLMNQRTVYDQIFRRVVQYSGVYQSIIQFKMNAAADEGVAQCHYPAPQHETRHTGLLVADPLLMDTLVHAGGFLCNMSAPEDVVFIGHSVEESYLLRSDFEEAFEVRCSNVIIRDGAMVIGDAVALDSEGVIAIAKGIHFQKTNLSRIASALKQALLTPATNITPAKQSADQSRATHATNGTTVHPRALARETLPAIPRMSAQTPVNHESVVLDMIAKTCNIARASIKTFMSLDALGIDSLLMLEMESPLRAIGNNSFTAVDFEKCVTVGDVVELINSPKSTSSAGTVAQGSDTRQNVIHMDKTQTGDTFDHVVNIISRGCSIPKDKIAAKMTLHELGIDSLLLIEMEKSFQEISKKQFTGIDFEKCIRVEDIVNLVGASQIDNSVETIQRPAADTHNATSIAQHTERAAPLDPARCLDSTLPGKIVDAIADSCRMMSEQLSPMTELDDLGIDSLMMLELENKFHKLAPNGFKTAHLKDCVTVADIVDLVTGKASTISNSNMRSTIDAPESSTSASMLSQSQTHTSPPSTMTGYSKINDPERRKRIPMDAQTEKLLIERLGLAQQPELLQSAPPGSEQKPAIFLIHAGSGFSRSYYRLCSLVDRDIYAIHDDKLLRQEESWGSVANVVQTYAELVRKTTKGQPAIISGWSFGGIIAYEVAKLLQREGRVTVPGLLLVDPPPPDGYTNPRVAQLLTRLFNKIFGVNSSRQNPLGDALYKIATSNAVRCADLLETYVATSAGKAPKTAYLYATDPVTTEYLAEPGDEHAPYDAWLCERENRELALGGWYRLLGRDIKIIDLPGNHYNILERDKVQTTSSAYIEACRWIESDG